jgi:hypothetical protein
MAQHTNPDAQTRAAEAEQARKTAGPDRPPTAEEAAAADGNTLDSSVSAHEREMNERGAHQQGEGRLP